MSNELQTIRTVLTKTGRVTRALGELSTDHSVLGHVQIIGPDGRVYLQHDIDFGAHGAWEVFQNVKYILLTEYFSVPLDREFGMDYSMVDKPIPVAEAVLVQEVAMKIALYEQRCQFTHINFSGDGLAGKLNPAVQVTILSTEELISRYPTGPYTPLVYTYVWPYPNPLEFIQKAGDVAPGETYLIVGLTPGQVADMPTSIAGLLVPGPQGLQGPPGPIGGQGPRGTMWFFGTEDPTPPPSGIGWPAEALVGDVFLNTVSGDLFQLTTGGVTRKLT